MKEKIKAAAKWLIGSAILIVFVLHGFNAATLPVVERLDGMASDMRLRTTLPLGIDQRIIIADIDEISLNAYGQWPWNRHYLAQLVDTLFDHYKVRTLGFDVVFAEAAGERFISLQNELKTSKALSAGTKQALNFEALQDTAFAKSLQGRSITAGILFQANSPNRLNTLPAPIAELDGNTHMQLQLPKPSGYTANRLEFHQASVAAGFFDNPVVDIDGNFRRVPLLQSYQGLLYPSLALAVAQQALGNPPLDIQMYQQGPSLVIESVQLGHRLIPTDSIGAVNVPFRGPEGSFRYISILDILEKKVPLETLNNKIILLGTSAPGLLDLRSTPVDESMPGVEVHANIVAGILDQNMARVPSYSVAAIFFIYLILGLFLLIVPHFLSPFKTLLFCILLIVGYFQLNFWLWSLYLMFPLASPIIMCIVFFIFHMSWGFFVESKKKREITRLFGQYVPPELVDEIAKNPEAIRLDGQSKKLSVLFSDVRGFTTISEKVAPQDLTLLMNRILTPMTEAIYQNLGTVDKYMGDAIMAFWGAPLDQPKHAYKAVLSALDMQQKVMILNESLIDDGFPSIKIGVGINTGVMAVGNMGSEYRMAYTVMGDAVNLGARLEGLSKFYGANIVVSEATCLEAPEFLYRPLDMVRVKGKTEPIKIFEPLILKDNASQMDRLKVSVLNEFFNFYYQQDWSQARSILIKLSDINDPFYKIIVQIYQERMNEFSITPLESGWDGVFEFTTK
jgi:adenylate cyclase